MLSEEVMLKLLKQAQDETGYFTCKCGWTSRNKFLAKKLTELVNDFLAEQSKKGNEQ